LLGITNYGGQTLAVNTSIDLAAKYRSDFKVFDHVTYMNSCSQGAIADSVKESFDTYLKTLELKGSAWGDWAGHQENVRNLLGKFFNVPANQIAVTTSASAGVDLSALLSAIDEETLIVSVTHVCFRNGTMTELEPIIEAAHKAGALVLVDAYQAVGAIPIDLSKLKTDFLVGGVLKYMLGAPGVGFMFARPETTSHLIPTATGWFAANNIFAMEIHGYDPAKDARRFESGTPAIPSLYPAAAGLEYILKIGLADIAAYVAPLHDELREGIAGLGYRVVTPKAPQNHAAMLAIATMDENAHVSALENEKVIVSSRDGNVRISPHFYNDREDVAKVIAAFAKTKQFLRG